MDNKQLLAVVGVLFAICMAFTACTAVGVFDRHSEPSDEVYTVYIGLNDSETHEDYKPDKVAPEIDKIVTTYCSGFTRYFANGAWSDDGTVSYEPSIVYVLCGTELSEVHKICDKVKADYHQQSILITISKDKVEFY